MHFPYEHYEVLAEPFTVYYPTGKEISAHWVCQTLKNAAELLTQLLGQPMPDLEVLLVDAADWQSVPRDELEDISLPHPYWTDVTSPPCVVIPTEIDPIFGEMTPEKLAFFLYHDLTLAYLEHDPRPWPDECPLWADEWQLKFASLWLSFRLDGQQGVVNKDLFEQYAEIFEPELDGKTPVTVRGFDWYEDTTPEDYLCYELLLEQFAADLLTKYSPNVLPHFLVLYRRDKKVLLSDDITAMLAKVLGPDGDMWLEDLVYF